MIQTRGGPENSQAIVSATFYWISSFLCSDICSSVCLPVDIEEITQKTGNYKKFGVFVKMLLTALARDSDSVFIDLLTNSDLVRTFPLPTLSIHTLESFSRALPSNKAGNAQGAENRTAAREQLVLIQSKKVSYCFPLPHKCFLGIPS